MRHIIAYISLCICSGSLHAQDFHYSMFDLMPTLISPSQTGNFSGDYRLSGLYRNQWRSVTVPFTSTAFNGEFKSPIANIKPLHLGTQIFHEVAGDSRFRQLFLNLSASYTLLPKFDSLSTIFFGGMLGINQNLINYDALYFNSQYNGFVFDPSLSSGETFENRGIVNVNSNIGMTWNRVFSKKLHASFSVAVDNLIKKNSGFDQAAQTLNKRGNYMLMASYQINDRYTLLPKFLMSMQSKYRLYVLGSDLKYKLNSKSKYAPQNVYAGISSRVKDALMVSVGADYKGFHGRFAYDFNYSNFTPATNRRGGFELGLVYIFKKLPVFNFKKCPDLI